MYGIFVNRGLRFLCAVYGPLPNNLREIKIEMGYQIGLFQYGN